MSETRILIADDHEVVRRGLRAILEAQSGWVVCGEASTGRDALEKTKRLKPDVAILDISMPELNGLDATRQIRKEVPNTQVLVLTVHESDVLVRQLLSAGAKGYLLKSDAGGELVAAVESVLQRKPFFTAKVAERVLDGYLKGVNNGEETGESAGGALTHREREVVQLLAEGKTTKEVAALLSISIHTAETHRANIMQKLHLHSLSEIVRYAIRNNLVTP